MKVHAPYAELFFLYSKFELFNKPKVLQTQLYKRLRYCVVGEHLTPPLAECCLPVGSPAVCRTA